jgi:glycine/D-amino acid oxidase-like deaminating enzyme
VESFEETAEGVNVILSDGTSILVDQVISAVGRWTNDITVAAGLGPVVTEYQEPGDVTVGYLAVTTPLPVAIDRVLTSPKLNIRPAGGGRLLLQALDLDTTASADTVPAIGSDLAREFVRRLQEILKNTGNAHITELHAGVRAMPADGRSVIGAVPSRPWLYLVVTHSGVTLAPFLGPAVAGEVFAEPSRFLMNSGPQGCWTATATRPWPRPASPGSNNQNADTPVTYGPAPSVRVRPVRAFGTTAGVTQDYAVAGIADADLRFR